MKSVVFTSYVAMSLFVASIFTISSACKSTSQAENAVFTTEQVVCMTAEIASGVFSGEVQQVAQQISNNCGIAQNLTSEVISLINNFLNTRAALQARDAVVKGPKDAGRK